MRDGHFDEHEPAFLRFRRQNVTRWGQYQHLLNKLSALIQSYSLPLVYLDTQKVQELGALDLDYYKRPDLLACFLNQAVVLDAMTNPAKMFRGA